MDFDFIRVSGLQLRYTSINTTYLITFGTLPKAEILSGKNAHAWVSMVLYLKK